MKTRPLIHLFAALALTLPVTADTFVLKDGTTLQGTILREQGDSYVIEVQVTKSIKDERTIAKADVAKIDREQPDAAAFEAIESLTPAPDALSADGYAARIRAVEKFLAAYPASSKKDQANAMLKTLKDEANEILAGGIKLSGKIVPASEYLANEYEIDARIQAAKIRDSLKEAKTFQALRQFSVLQRDFKNTTAYCELVPQMSKVIQAYQAEIRQSAATYDARIKQRAVGLDRMTPSDRASSERAIKEQAAALEAHYKAEKEAKVEWLTTNPFYKPSLDDTVTFATQELTRLAAVPAAPAVDAGKAYRDALSLIRGGADKTAITSAIASAKTALVAPRYIEKLETMAPAK